MGGGHHPHKLGLVSQYTLTSLPASLVPRPRDDGLTDDATDNDTEQPLVEMCESVDVSSAGLRMLCDHH